MIRDNQKKEAMKQTFKQIGLLIAKYLKDPGTSISSLRDETKIHFHTFKKVIHGDSEVRAIEVLLVIAELMQRDDTLGWSITKRFFTDLRDLLDDAFDNC